MSIWETFDDPSLLVSVTPRRLDDRTLPVDPALLDRFALAMTRRPWITGVTIAPGVNDRLEVHLAFDAPDGGADIARNWIRRLLRAVGLSTGVMWSSGPAGWGNADTWMISFVPRSWSER